MCFTLWHVQSASSPLWQDLDGPQLGSEWWTILGTQFAF